MSAVVAAADPGDWAHWGACPGSLVLQGIRTPVTGDAQASEYAAGVLRDGWGNTAIGEKHEPMRSAIAAYVDAVRGQVERFKQAGAIEVLLMPAQRLPLDLVTGEKNSYAVIDAVSIARFRNYSVLQIDELWYADHGVLDEQEVRLRFFALAAAFKYRALHDFHSSVMRLHLPGLDPGRWEMPIEDLLEFGRQVRASAELALALLDAGPVASIASSRDGYAYLKPGDQCSSCLARAKCPALIARTPELETFDGSDLA